jgi:hypothetical protein
MKGFRSKFRKPMIIGCTILFGLWALINLIFAIGEKLDIGHLTVGILFSFLSIGIYLQNRWALRLASVIFLLIAIILPIGVFNPFTAGDYLAAGMEIPSITATLLWLVPIEALLLFIVVVIDPLKKETETSESQKEILITPL